MACCPAFLDALAKGDVLVWSFSPITNVRWEGHEVGHTCPFCKQTVIIGWREQALIEEGL